MFCIFMQTPDGALLDILRNAHDLLSQCDIRLPEVYICILACFMIFDSFSFSLVKYNFILY